MRAANVIALAGAMLCGYAGPSTWAQLAPPPSGSLSGRLTDLRSAPLAGVAVVLRNQSTGAEWRATTAKNGVYRFASLVPGTYSLRAESARLGSGELNDIDIAAGHEARVQAAMNIEPALAVELARAAPPALAAPSTPVERPALAASPTPTAIPVSAALPEPAVPHLPIQPQSFTVEAGNVRETTQIEPLFGRPISVPAQLDTETVEPPAGLKLLAALNLPLEGLSPPAPGALLAAPIEAQKASPAQTAELQPDLASAAVTTTISGEQLQSLPTSGRRWQDIFLDTPAAAPGSASAQLALRGAGQDSPDTTIDGASTRLAFGSATTSGFVLPAQDPSAQNQSTGEGSTGFSGGRGLAISTAAVREVRVVAGNVESEGAHAAGGRAGVETESGSNLLHGQGFFSDRQNTWGARNPFAQWTQNTGTAAAPSFASLPFTPPDHETSWGIGAGSRIRRDRLFWFAAFDGYRRNDPGLATAKEPIGADQYGNCLGLFCPPSVPQTQLLSAQLGESEAQAYNDYMGIPRAGVAGAGLEQLAGLLGPSPRTAAQWVGSARLDWQAAERHRFTVEGTGADWNAPGSGLTRLSENYGNHSFGSSQASQEWLLARWEAFLTPNLLLVTQGSAGREILSAHADAPSPFEQGFLGAGWNSYGQLPQIVVDSRYGFTIGNPSRFGQGSYPDERMIHAQEMVDWVRGKLLVKAGFELDNNVDATTLLRNQTGSYHYSKVEDFISDALAFEHFGVTNLFNYQNPHNCSPTSSSLFGAIPCYSYFSQMIGPNYWQVSTNDWAGYTTAQWQLNKFAVFSAGLRWQREQLPQTIKLVDNPALPLTERLANLGNEWGPRMSLALGNRGRWPVLRLGYGMYFGRTENAALETALSQTGSLKGDLNFFIRPTDGLNRVGTSGAPPFPTVLTGAPGSVVVPGAVEYAQNFRNPEVHQAVAAVEQQLPGRVMLTASALLSLGRRLPAAFDANIDPAVNAGTITATNPGITYEVCDQVPTATGGATSSGGAPIGNTQCGHVGLGPIKATQITVPFYASWPAGLCPSGVLLNVAGQCGRLNPDYQQVTEIESRANSTYEATTLRVTRYGERGLSLHAHYTYAHAMDWNPGASPLNQAIFSQDFAQEYGTSNLDVRHSAAVMLVYEAPWKLRGVTGRLANGWMVSGIGEFHSGLPYTMRVTGSLPQEVTSSSTSSGALIVGLAPGMNGSGGDNRVYGLGNDGINYNIGRNTYRYPETWKADMRLGKKFFLGERRDLELLVESFNLFNHQNVTEIETTGYTIQSGSTGSLPTLNFLTGLKTSTSTGLPIPGFGQPLNINATDFYRERQIQLGVRLRF